MPVAALSSQTVFRFCFGLADSCRCPVALLSVLASFWCRFGDWPKTTLTARPGVEMSRKGDGAPARQGRSREERWRDERWRDAPPDYEEMVDCFGVVRSNLDPVDPVDDGFVGRVPDPHGPWGHPLGTRTVKALLKHPMTQGFLQAHGYVWLRVIKWFDKGYGFASCVDREDGERYNGDIFVHVHDCLATSQKGDLFFMTGDCFVGKIVRKGGQWHAVQVRPALGELFVRVAPVEDEA